MKGQDTSLNTLMEVATNVFDSNATVIRRMANRYQFNVTLSIQMKGQDTSLKVGHTPSGRSTRKD